jgi:hypothetical protein
MSPTVASESSVEAGVLECVGATFGWSAQDIPIEIPLYEQFGAESLDFMDIESRLRHRFDVAVNISGVVQMAGVHYRDEILADGRLTQSGYDKVAGLIPEVLRLERVYSHDVQRLLSVRVLTRLVMHALAEERCGINSRSNSNNGARQ